MTPVLLSFLLLFTIFVAFVVGIALSYWAVCGILYLFDPARLRHKPARRPTLAPSHGAD